MNDMQWLEEKSGDAFVQREFMLMRGERRVPGVLWTPQRASPGKPLVLFGHGASGDRHQTPIPYVARKLVAESGFSALAIDGPVHGRRKVGDGARGAFAVEWQRDGCVAVLGLMGIVGPTATYRQQICAAAESIVCPVLFLMQLHDELFTREQYLDLFDRMRSDDKRIHANPGLHPEVPVEELDYSAEFLARYLAGEGKTKRKIGFSVSQ